MSCLHYFGATLVNISIKLKLNEFEKHKVLSTKVMLKMIDSHKKKNRNVREKLGKRLYFFLKICVLKTYK